MNSYLTKISEEIASGKTPPPVTTREFLSWFGAQRRGYWIVLQIRNELESAKLLTIPDFESNYIDAQLRLVRAEEEVVERSESAEIASIDAHTVEAAEAQAGASTSMTEWVRRDPTYKISKLGPANQGIIGVRPDANLDEVVGLLLLKNFSQLPVMTSEREVKGIIT